MKHLSLLAMLSLLAATPSSADMLPGYDRFDLVAAHRARPVAASIWYPAANPTYRAPIGDSLIFDPSFAFIGPAIADGKHPLVLLSHGSGGNADTLGWLASALVDRGAIVLGVDHPGSSTGDSSPRRSVDLKARSQDLSAALDMVLAEPAFAASIDHERIGLVGFSLGGSTALALAGMRFDGEAQDEYCAAKPKAADCAFYHLGGVRFADYPGYESEARDHRIKRAAIIDPGFGYSAVSSSLDSVLPGLTLINLGNENRFEAADVGPAGNDLADRLPDATYVEIAPANHFTFLATCKPGAVELLEKFEDDPICTDPDGADRPATHAAIADAVAEGLGL